MRGGIRRRCPDELDERIRREIARASDHVLEQIVHAHRCPDPSIDETIGIVGGVQRIGRTVHDRGEFVLQLDVLTETELATIQAPEELDHHRHFHRARGVKALVGVEEQRVFPREIAKCDADRRSWNFRDAPFDARPQ